LTEHLIGKLGYLGIALILILGGLGLPIPEEAPIILAAVLTRNGRMTWPLALGSCLAGVLLGDMVVYGLGYFYGEKVLRLPLTRRLLTRQREAQIKGYFHRHGFKILVSGRFVPGFRTAAYLTAGILKLPPGKLLLTDLVAASMSTFLMFGLGYYCAAQIQNGGIREVQQWVTVAITVSLAVWLLHRYYRAHKASGLPVGPPVLDPDVDPLAIDDFRSIHQHKSIATAGRAQVLAPGENDRGSAAAPGGPGESGLHRVIAAPAVTTDDAIEIDIPGGHPSESGLLRAGEEIGARES
jgi:membrane protein DedA with SNARE-associated domain